MPIAPTPASPSTITARLEGARNHIEWALELSRRRDRGEVATIVDGKTVRIADLMKRYGYDAREELGDALARIQIEEEGKR